MADYARSEQGLAVLDRGISDIKEGRVLIGRGSLSAELTRRAST
jgi:DNA-directed RNA polymerase subunit E'/Rpb7